MLSPDGDSHHTLSHLALEFVVLREIANKEGYAPPDGDSHHTRSHLALEFVVLCDIEKKEGYAFPRTCGLAFPSLPGMTSRVLKRSLLPDESLACACGRSLAEFSPTRYDDL